ncbi:shikimate dehydrogenase family protein [Mucilaginibacter pedocola]|uniref:Shikimate dehydrogenase n=1 Tax=Mucilaginibacter pedocola TaxID=1792845 RepID=A0A1S9P9E5_9SPHI|nr:shikimate dehydrogenase [Mucilaginibacter pedocola]OOQ57580.1 shikimate dehydrogenase [Mucilaginibacter pedocola]
MKKYGLIGFPLSHSFSKKYFTEKFVAEHIEDSSYDLYPLEHVDGLINLLHSNPELCGINVTIPHKVNVMKYLNWIEHDAKNAGAVNCIKVISESPVSAAFSGELGIGGHDLRLEGYNTDIHGFEGSLSPLLTHHHDKALILGDGGAAKAVKCVLDNKGIDYVCVTRKPVEGNILFDDLTVEMIAEYKLIINTTPIGTYPNVDECPPIPYDGVGEHHLLFDLVYNPPLTKFLQMGDERRATTKNGYEMLVLQAEKAWEIWNSND